MSELAPSRVLVTGAGGFVGGHLLRYLRQAGLAPAQVVAMDLKAGDVSLACWISCDLTCRKSVRAAIADAAPDAIIHLAGITHGQDMDAYFAVNVQAGANVLSAAAAMSKRPRVLMMGSAAQYGITSGDRELVDESRPLLAATPYGISKCMQEQWSLAAGRSTGLEVICARPFNIMGPGQSVNLVPATFLAQLADVLAGRSAAVMTGNTSTERDFLDVRDVVAALWAMVRSDRTAGGVFNIASGQGVMISDILAQCVALAGRDVPVRQDPRRLKGFDVPSIIGDNRKLLSATDWQPTISWRQSLQDMWNEFGAQHNVSR